MAFKIHIGHQVKRDFHENGVVCLKNVFDQEWVNKSLKGIEKNLQNPSQYSESLKGKVGEGAYFNDYLNWNKIDEFKDYIFNSPAKEIVSQLLDTQYLSFYYEHIFVKDPGASKVTPWHQDITYFPLTGHKTCILWMPIDPVSEQTCIQFVKGSHKWGKWFYPKKFATENNYPTEYGAEDVTEYEAVPDIDDNLDKYQILTWSLEPGDCIAFNMKLLHGAPPNTTDVPRRVISTRWLGDDCVMTKRPWVTSPPVTGGLKLGDPFICDQFPLVWGGQ